VSYAYNNKPDFMESAESRVGSYLTSDYGKVPAPASRLTITLGAGLPESKTRKKLPVCGLFG
jgi:hypothetical protein